MDSILSSLKSKINKKECERSSQFEINKYLKTLIQTQDEKNLDLENRIDSMIKFKQIVKSSSSIQWKGCHKVYITSLFTPHVKLCPKLDHNALKLQVVEYRLENEKDKANSHYVYVIEVNFAGTSWTVERRYKEFYELHKKLLEESSKTENMYDNEQQFSKTYNSPSVLNEFDFQVLSKAVEMSQESIITLVKERLKFLQAYTDFINI